MAIIVTGASGQFGRSAAEKLLDRVDPADLILTTRTPDKLADLAARGAQVRIADFDRTDTLAEAFAGGRRMLLISTARVGTRVEQHRNAIQAARAAGVEHVAYTSVMGADDPDNPAIVKLDHRATELDLEASGLAWTFFRDSQYAEAVAGPVMLGALQMGKQLNNNGGGKVSLVAREDCVDCAVAVLTTPGHENAVYEPTGPEALSFEDCMAMFEEMTGRHIPSEIVDSETMFEFFDALGAPRHASDIVPDGPIPWSSDDMVTFGEAIAQGVFSKVTNDVETLTGHKPTPFRQVMEAFRPAWPV